MTETAERLFTVPTLTTREAIVQLDNIQASVMANLAAIDRKTSWRPSEKAMSKAHYMRSLAALDMARAALKAAPGAGPLSGGPG